uniref:NADH dehydrogenase subunit 4 n=1 Tax=Latona dysoni TaxID=3246695 RepID=UPI002113DAA0|nr:NADH dehydrogenase subunit 4 [Donax dysoni]UTM92211.1 NADH dehydrogenase subunit 4 [Donax dysoni]
MKNYSVMKLPQSLSSCIVSALILGLVLVELLSLSRFNHMTEGLSMGAAWWMEDTLAVSLASLTVFVVIISLIASDADFNADVAQMKFTTAVSLVGIVCTMVFMSSKIFFFFFFFESSLLPTVVLILGWGYQPERLQAGLQMVVYTVCGSLPLLVLLCVIWGVTGSDSMIIISFMSFSLLGDYMILWLFLLLGMLVKVPVFTVHGWLPKAHVEAPLAGSMLLAGVLLKLGIYGICRVCMVVGSPNFYFISGLISLSLWGGVLCSFLCLCFYDVKSVIAYSSISHMALSLAGVVSLVCVGWMGGICMCLAHGICSPCLFALANYSYSVTGSRSIMLCKGMLKGIPVLSAMWFMFCAFNLGCPPSINFFSECFLFCIIFGYSSIMLLPLFLLCFLAAGYSLFIYSSINHGYQSSVLRSSQGLSSRFMVVMVVSVVLLFFISIMLDMVFI